MLPRTGTLFDRRKGSEVQCGLVPEICRRASGTRRSVRGKGATRPSDRRFSTPRAALRTPRRRNTTPLSPTSAMRSGSIRKIPLVISHAALRISGKANTIMLLRTTTRRSGLIRTLFKRSTNVLGSLHESRNGKLAPEANPPNGNLREDQTVDTCHSAIGRGAP
jgi:hypothetical protein